MADKTKTSGTIAIESFAHSSEALLKGLEHALEHAKLDDLAESTKGLSNVLSVKEVASAVVDAIGAAKHGDWNEFSAKMGEAASVAPNMATGGIYGLVEAVWDAGAAVAKTDGGEDYSFGTLSKSGFDIITTRLSDIAFGLVHADAVADFRVNPTGPDDDEAPEKSSGTGLYERLDHSPLAGLVDVPPDDDGVMRFEPEVVVGRVQPEVMTFAPEIVIGHVGSEMTFDPDVVTDDQRSDDYGPAVLELPDTRTDDASIPVGDLVVPPISDQKINDDGDDGFSLGNLQTFDDSSSFDGDFAVLRNGISNGEPFDTHAFDTIVPDHGSIPELGGWCGTESLDVAPTGRDIDPGFDANMPDPTNDTGMTLPFSDPTNDAGLDMPFNSGGQTDSGGQSDPGFSLPDLGAPSDPGGGFEPGGFDPGASGDSFGGFDFGGSNDSGGGFDGGYVPVDTGSMS